MNFTIVTAPTVEPLTLHEVKNHLKVESDENDDDRLIEGLITAARETGELMTRRSFITQTWDLFLDRFPLLSNRVDIPFPLLQSITTIKYIDTEGVQQTLSSSLYIVDVNSKPGRVTPAYSEVWPDTRAQINAVEIRFVAGYGAKRENVPEALRLAMLNTIGAWYENRATLSDITGLKSVPLVAGYVFDHYKVRTF